MRAHSALLGTSVGAKALVAVSGLAFAAWCALHVLGNVAAFAGPAALDGYAAWLRRVRRAPVVPAGDARCGGRCTHGPRPRALAACAAGTR